jgi:hypothetical protein
MQLYNEYDHMSSHEFCEHILDNLKRAFGVDLRPTFTAPGLSDGEKLRRASAELLEGVFANAQREGYWYDWNADDAADEEKALDRSITAKLTVAAVEEEPNLSFIPSDLTVIRGYRGDQLKTYLFSLTKRLENMSNAKTAGQLAIELTAGGLISVGVPMAVGAVKALRAGLPLLQAIRAGITSIGLKTAIGAVVVVLVGFLLWLFLENPKKLLGLLINDTDDDFVVNDWRKGVDGEKSGDLFVAFGHMANFMVDHEGGLASPEVQIRARQNFGPSDPDNVVFGGIYFADRNFGLRGAEGLMILTAKSSGRRFAHLYACPYFEDNGTYLDIVGAGSSDKFYYEFYPKRRVSMETEKERYKLQANVNDARGGVVGLIAIITQA